MFFNVFSAYAVFLDMMNTWDKLEAQNQLKSSCNDNEVKNKQVNGSARLH